MKLDPSALRYLSDDDFRVLTAVELGMRNHELVPIPLISSISGLRHGGYMRALKQIHKAKLVHKESSRYVGYRLTPLGYDFLALRALVKRGVLSAVGRPLGVGKEADVFIVAAAEELLDAHPDLADDQELAMKLHRLGRTSFRTVKTKRDYLGHRRAASWIYLSRLAAAKEYAFMCALHRRGFPVPRPLGQSRHVVIMQLVSGSLLAAVHEHPDPHGAAMKLLDVATRLARHGLVHCDLNEFNIMVDDEGVVTVIDFPQMVSTSHPDAAELLERDVAAIRRFFHHRFGISEDDLPHPVLEDILKEREDDVERLDKMVSASGFRNVDNADGAYGVQDVGEEPGAHQGSTQIDPSSLQLVGAPAAPDKPTDKPSDSRVATAGPTQIEDDDDDGDDETVGVQIRDRVDKSEKASASNPAQDIEDADARQADDDASSSAAAASIDRAAIEARVRAQRSNRSHRQMYAKRNIIKDSEKRKVKVEMKSGMWD